MEVGESRYRTNERGSEEACQIEAEIKRKRDKERTMGNRKVHIDYGQVVPVEWCLKGV